MKVVSKGEPVSNAEALKCVRKKLQELRKAPVVQGVPEAAAQCAAASMDVDADAETDDAKTWQRRLRKLQNFSLTQEEATESDGGHVPFLEAVERYLASNV